MEIDPNAVCEFTFSVYSAGGVGDRPDIEKMDKVVLPPQALEQVCSGHESRCTMGMRAARVTQNALTTQRCMLWGRGCFTFRLFCSSPFHVWICGFVNRICC